MLHSRYQQVKIIMLVCSILLVILLVYMMDQEKEEIVVGQSFEEVNQNITEVSIINLISNPEKYDGELIRVVGVANIAFESNALYLSKEDYKNSITKNAVWLKLNYDQLNVTQKVLDKLNGKYVLIEGILNMNNKGHFDKYSGSIEKIARLERWN
ncbi:hypothetical protein [Paenibacillus sp. FJAT-26967]|uniref:hypothetical protein n=1 Tax=Paenibacillus sp. FJAT-26967 TaxID=1729690 RepID=UPI00083964A1|nr:hypothetical protein [Paenibacillus sp. FJAT-26967]